MYEGHSAGYNDESIVIVLFPQLNPYSAVVDFSRQNLTSVDVRF